MTETYSTPTLLTIKQFSEKHPAWTQAGLRGLILNAEDRQNSRGHLIQGNGLEVAIVRVGRKVLIDGKRPVIPIIAFMHW